jgi:hypothetical protein
VVHHLSKTAQLSLRDSAKKSSLEQQVIPVRSENEYIKLSHFHMEGIIKYNGNRNFITVAKKKKKD